MSQINWNETYINISPKLLGICRRYIKDIATAEDIVQDSFIVAMQKESSLKNINALNGWLSKIVINMAIHHLKETKKTIFATSEIFDVADNSTTMNTTELNNKSALLAADLDKNDVLQAIDNLPENQKSVFNMYVIDQFSHKEIAKILEISEGTSKSNLSRARKSIQTYLLEKIKEKPANNNKKRYTAILIFLGFGNAMFGNLCRKSFHNFEIPTSKSFLVKTKTISQPNKFIGLSKSFYALKTFIFAVSIVGLVGLIYVLNKTPETTKKPIENLVTTTEKNAVNVKKENSTTIVKTTIIQEDKTIKQKQKTIANSQKISEKKSVTLKKDSIKTNPKKVVVIKKQIIKRDTIYVTR